MEKPKFKFTLWSLSIFLTGILCYFCTAKASGLYFDLVQYFDSVIYMSMISDSSSYMQEVYLLIGEVNELWKHLPNERSLLVDGGLTELRLQ